MLAYPNPAPKPPPPPPYPPPSPAACRPPLPQPCHNYRPWFADTPLPRPTSHRRRPSPNSTTPSWVGEGGQLWWGWGRGAVHNLQSKGGGVAKMAAEDRYDRSAAVGIISRVLNRAVLVIGQPRLNFNFFYKNQ